MSASPKEIHPSIQTSVSATALLIGAGILAMPFTASAGEIADLCGETITTHVTIVDVVDAYGNSCYIEIADGASLTLKGSTFTAEDEIEIAGLGSGAFTMIGSHLTSDYSRIDISTVDGAIDILFESSVDAGGRITLESEFGNISVKDSDLGAGSGNVDLDSDFGNVSVKNSSLSVSESGDVRAEGYDVSVKSSVISTVEGEVTFEADNQLTFVDNEVYAYDIDVDVELSGNGSVTVKDNDFHLNASSGADLSVESDYGNVTFKDNIGNINGDDNSGNIRIRSESGNISVWDNSIGLAGDNTNEVEIDSSTGNVTVKNNEFTGADDLWAEAGGNCTSTGNTPAISCS